MPPGTIWLYARSAGHCCYQGCMTVRRKLYDERGPALRARSKVIRIALEHLGATIAITTIGAVRYRLPVRADIKAYYFYHIRPLTVLRCAVYRARRDQVSIPPA